MTHAPPVPQNRRSYLQKLNDAFPSSLRPHDAKNTLVLNISIKTTEKTAFSRSFQFPLFFACGKLLEKNLTTSKSSSPNSSAGVAVAKLFPADHAYVKRRGSIAKTNLMFHTLTRMPSLASNIRRFTVAVLLFSFALLGTPALGQTSRFAAPLRVRFVTFNVNFNLGAAKVQADVAKVEPKADVIMFQEAKSVTIDNFLDANWTVYQVIDQGDAKRGSALAVRNSLVSSILAQGLRFGVDRDGQNMLDRYIAWMDVRFTNGLTMRVMSLHMPPKSIEYLQPRMANNFNTFVAETPYPVIAGGDWNFTVDDDKWNIEGATGLTSDGVGIDGFYYDAAHVDNKAMYRLAGLEVNSDHDPVQLVSDVYDSTPSSVSAWTLY